MEEKKKMNLDEMKKAKMPLNNEEMVLPFCFFPFVINHRVTGIVTL